MTTKKEKIRQLEWKVDDLKGALEVQEGLTEQYRGYYNAMFDAVTVRNKLISAYEEFIEKDPERTEEFRKFVVSIKESSNKGSSFIFTTK